MFVSRQFVKCSSFITLFLPCLTIATPYFTNTPNDNTTKYVGDDVVLNWTYVAPSKDTDFGSLSPVWNYYYPNGTKMVQLASENKAKGWKWEISNTCPTRLRYPVQRIFKSKPGDQFSASLTITNLTLADSGKYECRLERSFFQPVVDKITLTVTAPPPVTTAVPTTTPTIVSPTGPPSSKPTEGSTMYTAPFNMTCASHFNIKELAKDENHPFIGLKEKIHNLFSSVYQSSFISLNETEFRKEGSVIIVYFEVTLYNVSEPFAILKKAMKDSGGTLHGLKIVADSIQSGPCTPPTTKPPAPTTDGLGTGEIIGIVIGVLAVIIVIVVIVVWLVKRPKNNGQMVSNNPNDVATDVKLTEDRKGAVPSSNNKGNIGSNKSNDVATDVKLTEDGKNAVHPV